MSRKKPNKVVLKGFGERFSALVPASERKQFAKDIGVSYESVRKWANGESLPDAMQLLNISKLLNKPMVWLLTGVCEFEVEPALKESGHNIVVLKHMDLVKDFDDPETAFNINKNLQIIEKLDRDAFLRIEGHVEGVASHLKKTPVVGDRRKRDRRLDGELAKGYTGDRRSGKDRRKVS